MIIAEDKDKICYYADKYGVESILLFGSASTSDIYNDIDIAVSGIKPEEFFCFYGDLLMDLSKPVDLIDLSQKSLFTDMVMDEGIKLYG